MIRIPAPTTRGAALLVAATLGCIWSTPAAGQAIPKPDYFTYMPPGSGSAMPIQQTRATAELNLFGDQNAPGYRDVDPRDGIDDRRNVWFMQLSEQFAPWIVRHAAGFPMDFRRWL
jgi:hypothetical protein